MKRGKQLKKYLWAFFVFPLVTIVLYGFVIQSVTRPKREEKISLFVGAYRDFGLEDALQAKRPDGIREVNVDFALLGSTSFRQQYRALWSNEDAILLPESQLGDDPSALLNSFVSFSAETINQLLPGEHTFYSWNSKLYGIQVFSQESEKGWGDNLLRYTQEQVESENFYLFFVPTSPHLGNLVKDSHDAAIFSVLQTWEAIHE